MLSGRSVKRGLVILLVLLIMISCAGCSITGKDVYGPDENVPSEKTWQLDSPKEITDPCAKIMAGEGYETSDLMKTMGEIEEAKTSLYEFLESVAKSDVKVKLKRGDGYKLTGLNHFFPALEGIGDTGFELKLIDDPADFRLTYDGLELDDEDFSLEENEVHTTGLWIFYRPTITGGEGSSTELVFKDKSCGSADVSINIGLENISSEPMSDVALDIKVDGNLVRLNNTVVAEGHGGFVGLNFMVTEGVGGVGSTAGEVSPYSTKGAAIKRNGLWYYVNEVEGPEPGESKGKVTLEEASSGKKITLDWNVIGSSSTVAYGQVVGESIYAYDYVSESYTDGISFNPSSTAVIKYRTEVESFKGETDWSTYTKLVFDTGEVDIGYKDGEIVLTPSGFDEDVEAKKNSDGSITLSEPGDVKEFVEVRIFADTNTSAIPEALISGEGLTIEAAEDEDHMVLLGWSNTRERITSACGELVLPDGEHSGSSWYNRDRLIALLVNESEECPLEKARTPHGNYITFYEYIARLEAGMIAEQDAEEEPVYDNITEIPGPPAIPEEAPAQGIGEVIEDQEPQEETAWWQRAWGGIKGLAGKVMDFFVGEEEPVQQAPAAEIPAEEEKPAKKDAPPPIIEVPPLPTPEAEAPIVPEPTEEKGFFGRAWDKVIGAWDSATGALDEYVWQPVKNWWNTSSYGEKFLAGLVVVIVAAVAIVVFFPGAAVMIAAVGYLLLEFIFYTLPLFIWNYLLVPIGTVIAVTWRFLWNLADKISTAILSILPQRLSKILIGAGAVVERVGQYLDDMASAAWEKTKEYVINPFYDWIIKPSMDWLDRKRRHSAPKPKPKHKTMKDFELEGQRMSFRPGRPPKG